MAVATVDKVTKGISEVVEAQQGWLDPAAETLQSALTSAIRGGRRGRPLGQDIPERELARPPNPRPGDLGPADRRLDDGLIHGPDRRPARGRRLCQSRRRAAVPTALAGVADWHDTVDRDRRVGVLAHALLNSAALTLFVGSIAARGRGSRALGVGLSTAGWALDVRIVVPWRRARLPARHERQPHGLGPARRELHEGRAPRRADRREAERRRDRGRRAEAAARPAAPGQPRPGAARPLRPRWRAAGRRQAGRRRLRRVPLARIHLGRSATARCDRARRRPQPRFETRVREGYVEARLAR